MAQNFYLIEHTDYCTAPLDVMYSGTLQAASWLTYWLIVRPSVQFYTEVQL